MRSVNSLAGKEPELVCEVEQYKLDQVGLTFTHSEGSGTKFLRGAGLLSNSRVALVERCQVGVGIVTRSMAKCLVVEC